MHGRRAGCRVIERPHAVAGSIMKQRRITLSDGRYLIFFTFDDEESTAVPHDEAAAVAPGAVAPGDAKQTGGHSESPEERHV